jgi:tryptophan halogenase
VFRYEDELFARPSWVAVFLGQNILPRRCDPIVAALPADQVRQSLDSMHAAMLAATQAMPTHADFIQRYCAAESA